MKKISLLLLCLLLISCGLINQNYTTEEDAIGVDGLYSGETKEAKAEIRLEDKEMNLKFELLAEVKNVIEYRFTLKDRFGKDLTSFTLPQIGGSKEGVIEATLTAGESVKVPLGQVNVTINGTTYEVPLKKN